MNLTILHPAKGKHHRIVGPADQAAAIAEAKADLHAAASLDHPEGDTWEVVLTALNVLAKAVETWVLIESGDLPWDEAYRDLTAEAGGCAGYDLALAMAAEQVEAAHAALGSAMSAHCRGGNKTTSTTGVATA